MHSWYVQNLSDYEQKVKLPILSYSIEYTRVEIQSMCGISKDNRIGHENLTLKFSFNYV